MLTILFEAFLLAEERSRNPESDGQSDMFISKAIEKPSKVGRSISDPPTFYKSGIPAAKPPCLYNRCTWSS
jgi:hypothetical protein